MATQSIGAKDRPRVTERWFYPGMALACLAVSIVGFLPTYVLPLAQGSFNRPPAVHLHGVLFFAWMVYVCLQSWLVAHGRVQNHRVIGLFGAGLATAMVFAFFIISVAQFAHLPAAALSLSWNGFAQMIFFVGCVGAALANVRRPEVHKRLMLLATASLLTAPIGRWVVILAGIQPSQDVSFVLPDWGLPCVVLLPALVFDHRTQGRVSRVYAIGLPAFLALGLVGRLIGATPAWLSTAEWLKGFWG